jgi:flagellar motor switch protein FliN/FliY
MEFRPKEQALKPILSAWLASLASVIESLTGARPQIQPAVSIGANSVPAELLWWEQTLDTAGLSVWIGAGPSVRQALGCAASGAVAIGDPGGRDAERSFQVLLQRCWQGVEGAVGGGRLTTPPPDEQLFRIPIEMPGTGAIQIFAACREAREETRHAKADRPPRKRAGTTLDLLLDTEIPLTVRFGSARMLLRDIVRLSPGSVVGLNRGMAEPVDIVVNGRLVARGDIVSVQGNYALRITEIRERRILPVRDGASTGEFFEGARS